MIALCCTPLRFMELNTCTARSSSLQEKPHQPTNLLQAAGDRIQSCTPFRCTHHTHLTMTKPVSIQCLTGSLATASDTTNVMYLVKKPKPGTAGSVFTALTGWEGQIGAVL